MHVGWLEAESGSFWDGRQRPELRAGQYCTGDTRLGVEPSNPTIWKPIRFPDCNQLVYGQGTYLAVRTLSSSCADEGHGRTGGFKNGHVT
eukprot:5225965-Prymnesium_polylepis.1